jgi:hypothetical protein
VKDSAWIKKEIALELRRNPSKAGRRPAELSRVMNRDPKSDPPFLVPMAERLPPELARLNATQRFQLAFRMQALGNLARKVFLDRNANGMNMPGMPKRDRLQIKSEMRPYLRAKIRWARKSRDALLAGDIERHELLRDRARMYKAFAMLEFFQPYANEYAKGLVRMANVSAKGAEATAAKYARPELDALIRACLERGELTRKYTKEWAGAFGGKDKVYRAIKRVKLDIAKKNSQGRSAVRP